MSVCVCNIFIIIFFRPFPLSLHSSPPPSSSSPPKTIPPLPHLLSPFLHSLTLSYSLSFRITSLSQDPSHAVMTPSTSSPHKSTSPHRRSKMSSFHTTLLISLAAASLSTLHLTPLVSAQIPVPLCCMAYATTHDQKTFFVQGGSGAQTHDNNQFFSLDLSQPSWNTTVPPWKPLSVGAGNTASSPVDYGLAMAVSKDDTMLMEWGTRIGVATYDIGTGVWAGKGVGKGARTGFFGYQAATDPNTGLVYIPSAMNNSTRMMVYNFVTGARTLAPMPSAKLLRLPVGKYAWAWNGARQSMLLHGGANYGNTKKPFANPNLLEFLPATSTWRRLVRPFFCKYLCNCCNRPSASD